MSKAELRGKDLVVLSDERQLSVFRDGGFSPGKGCVVLSDNPSFLGSLSKNGVPFTYVGERDLKDRWQAINSWACDKALNWDKCLDFTPFGGMEINKVLYVYFTYYLVSLLKNHLFADMIVRSYAPARILVFKGVKRPGFPAFNGNHFLNLSLEKKARDAGIKVSYLQLADGPAGGVLSGKEKLRAMIEKIFASTLKPGDISADHVMRGSLKHTGLIVREMARKGQKVCVLDKKFHIEQLLFCLRNGLAYYLPGSFKDKDAAGGGAGVDYAGDFIRTIETLREKRWFVHGEDDLSDIVCDGILETSGAFVKDLYSWHEICAGLTKARGLKGLVIDEDWTPSNAFLAAFFRNRGLRSFCMSHGYGAISFSLDDSLRTFSLSETFVQSGYEKDLYSSKGWDEKHLHATGVPRYDRLCDAAQARKAARKVSGRPMRLLFCGGTLIRYAPDQATYAGGREFVSGDCMRRCLADVLEAVEGLDIDLVVRPHNVDDEEVWNSFLKAHGRRIRASLVSSKVDFFGLLRKCDAMVLGHWSTAIIESVTCGIPTVVHDRSGLEDGHPFAREGLCAVTREKGELGELLGKLSYFHVAGNRAGMFFLTGPGNGRRGYYTGTCDGGNTDRVMKKVLDISGERYVTSDTYDKGSGGEKHVCIVNNGKS